MPIMITASPVCYATALQVQSDNSYSCFMPESRLSCVGSTLAFCPPISPSSLLRPIVGLLHPHGLGAGEPLFSKAEVFKWRWRLWGDPVRRAWAVQFGGQGPTERSPWPVVFYCYITPCFRRPQQCTKASATLMAIKETQLRQYLQQANVGGRNGRLMNKY